MANGQYNYAKSGFLASLDDAGIDTILDVYQREPVEFLLFLRPLADTTRTDPTAQLM